MFIIDISLSAFRLEWIFFTWWWTPKAKSPRKVTQGASLCVDQETQEKEGIRTCVGEKGLSRMKLLTNFTKTPVDGTYGVHESLLEVPWYKRTRYSKAFTEKHFVHRSPQWCWVVCQSRLRFSAPSHPTDSGSLPGPWSGSKLFSSGYEHGSVWQKTSKFSCVFHISSHYPT